jgi:uncharacterized protein GlcG (DUF336 family)
MPNVVKKLSISSELARKMANAAVAKAKELGVAENVAILDDGGNLKAFTRMDGAPIPTIEMAQRRADGGRTTSIARQQPWHSYPLRWVAVRTLNLQGNPTESRCVETWLHI